jgi:hypothetical protein
MGMSQFMPIQPATHVPHVYPFEPSVMQPVMLCTQGSGVHEVLTVPLELLLLEVLVELLLEAPPVPLELLLEAPPVPLELLLDVPPVPLELLLDAPPVPLELLLEALPLPLELLEDAPLPPPEPVLAVVCVPFEEPHPVARRPTATTEIANQGGEEGGRMSNSFGRACARAADPPPRRESSARDQALGP